MGHEACWEGKWTWGYGEGLTDIWVLGKSGKWVQKWVPSPLKCCIFGSTLTSLFPSLASVYPSIQWKNGLYEPIVPPTSDALGLGCIIPGA